MWRPLEHEIEHVVMIIKCCVILHNVCIREWLTSKADGDGNYIPVPPHHDVEDEENLTVRDETVMDRWDNHYEGMRERARSSNIRVSLTQENFDSRFRVTEEQCINHSR